MPPSKGVPSGPWISASQAKRSSSSIGPAVMPSGGEVRRDLYSAKRRFDATLVAMLLWGLCSQACQVGSEREEEGIAIETFVCTTYFGVRYAVLTFMFMR